MATRGNVPRMLSPAARWCEMPPLTKAHSVIRPSVLLLAFSGRGAINPRVSRWERENKCQRLYRAWLPS